MTDIPFREKVLRILKAGGTPESQATAIAAIKERTFAKRLARAPSALSRDMASLFPGQFVETIEQCRQTVHARMKTARDILRNPEARWRVDKVSPGVIRITRVPDNEPYHRGIISPKVLEMCSLKVDESIISSHITSVRSKGAIGTNHKISARRFLKNDEADWSVRSTSLGVRLTRVR